VGPNVTIETGSQVIDSTIANSILGRNVRVERARVQGALIGDDQVVLDRSVEDAVLDQGELAPAR
jgi:hypothetical protein